MFMLFVDPLASEEQLVEGIVSLCGLVRASYPSDKIIALIKPSLLRDTLQLVFDGIPPEAISARFVEMQAGHVLPRKHAKIILRGVLLLQAGTSPEDVRSALRPDA